MSTVTGTIRGFSQHEADSSTARLGDIDLDVAVTSPRGDSYSLARFTTDHIATNPETGAKYVISPGDPVQFTLNIEPATYDREAYDVRPV